MPKLKVTLSIEIPESRADQLINESADQGTFLANMVVLAASGLADCELVAWEVENSRRLEHRVDALKLTIDSDGYVSAVEVNE